MVFLKNQTIFLKNQSVFFLLKMPTVMHAFSLVFDPHLEMVGAGWLGGLE
jgi:hypothetical protein